MRISSIPAAAAAILLGITAALSAVDAKEPRKKAADGGAGVSISENDPAWNAAYVQTLPLWERVKKANPALEPGQKFFRTYVARMRASGKIAAYGEVFERLIGGLPAAQACSEFFLCGANEAHNFHLTAPLAITDIVRYTFEATCYGYIEDATHRIAALHLLDAVIGEIGADGFADLVNSLQPDDSVYLSGRFSDMVTTAAHFPPRIHRATFSKLRSLAAPAGKKNAKGNVRLASSGDAEAAAKVCAGH